MNKQIINKGKSAVFIQDHIGLKSLYNDINQSDYQINLSDLFLNFLINLFSFLSLLDCPAANRIALIIF